MIKRFFILMIAMCAMSGSAFAQSVTPGLEMGELIRIGYTFRQVPNLSFNINYKYADSTAPSTILEQVNGQYKIHDGRYWAMLDSTELVQGNNYSLAVFHEDKVISVHKPQYMDAKIMQLPVTDSILSLYTDSIRVTQLTDTTRLLNIYFKPAIPYSGYQIRYNSVSYLVDSLQFYQREINDSTTHTSFIKVKMTNYSEAVISEDYFMESKFIYRDGTFYKRPDYSDYELVVDGDF